MVPVWSAPQACCLLSGKDVHIWRSALDLPETSIQEFKKTLSSDERVKVQRFRFERDRNRFIVRLGILRTILGSYLDVEPGEVRFSYGDRGKPRLGDPFAKTGVRFNLSHSDGLALYAFTRDREVGVDIERIRAVPEMQQIAEQFFSVRENAVFRTTPSSERKEEFFACWTLKEAFIKAIGEGFSYPLERFDVSFASEQPSSLLAIDGDSERASQWFLLSLKPAPGFIAALATKAHGWRLHFWRWPDQPSRTLAQETSTQRPSG